MSIQNIRSMEVVSSWGADLASETVFPVENCWSLRRGQVYMVHSAGSGLKCQHVDKSFTGSYLDIPLAATGEIMGLLHLEWPLAEELDSKNRESINNFANIVSLSLSNIKLRETLHNQSVRDPLTHAYNRRYMEESLNRELPRARRKNGHIGLIMLDIDFFKKVNDTYGHAAGDLVLTSVVNRVQSLVRFEDIVCRLGGEEFLVIMPDTDLNVSLQRAETIRQAVQALQIEYSDQTLIKVTISAGVSVFPEHGSTSDELLEKADAALYRAKGGGRNRVEVAE